jgi:hypothetical protein
MLTPMVASLALPYVQKDAHWVMLAARTSKSLSAFLDVAQHHWETRFQKLLTRLRSGRARFEIRRYVSCCTGDSIFQRIPKNLDGFAFTVSIADAAPHSFARQAVPQLKQIMRIMKGWNRGGSTTVVLTANRPKRARKAGCGQMHYVGAIPLRTASTPSELVSGNLDALADWVEDTGEGSGFETDESWECKCGKAYSASW